MRNAALVVSLTLLHLTLHLAKGDYTVSLWLSSYSNPSHLRANGHCCDIGFNLFFVFCEQCDNYFVICAAEDSCVHTGEVGGDRLRFRSRVGGLDNPVQIAVPGQWRGSLMLVIDVYDDDDFFPLINQDDFVDQFRITIPLSLDTASGSGTYRGRYRRGTIILSATVTCSRDYYGSDCSVFCAAGETYSCGPDGGKVCLRDYYGEECAVYCQPVVGQHECTSEGDRDCASGYYGSECDVFCEGRDDDSGHYSCGEEGEKVCLAGWTEPESNCVTSLCVPPCSAEGGRCSASGLCVCEPGWRGETCQECWPHQNCSPTGGYCRKPNECRCREGFSGEFCATILPTATPTATPTDTLTDAPTDTPTDSPTTTPTASLTDAPTDTPTDSPTTTPTASLTDAPTGTPTASLTDALTATPTDTPTDTPTRSAAPGATPTLLLTTTSTVTAVAVSITTPTATPTTISTLPFITTPTATPTTTNTTLPVTTPIGDSGEEMEGDEEGREGEDSTGGFQSAEGNGSSVVGGVVGGLLSLLALVALLVTVFYCLWMVRRKRRKQAGRSPIIEEDDTLTMPLVGENPIYMDQVMGSHILERNKNSHQFDNPLYRSHEAEPPSGGQQQDPSSGSTHTYSSIEQYRVPSVYLPGDDSPLSASLSSTEGSRRDPRYSYVEHRRSGHRHHHPASWQTQQNSIQRDALSNHNSPEQGAGAEEGEAVRPNSLHTQYFHLPLNGTL